MKVSIHPAWGREHAYPLNKHSSIDSESAGLERVCELISANISVMLDVVFGYEDVEVEIFTDASAHGYVPGHLFIDDIPFLPKGWRVTYMRWQNDEGAIYSQLIEHDDSDDSPNSYMSDYRTSVSMLADAVDISVQACTHVFAIIKMLETFTEK